MKTICLDFDGVIHSFTSPWGIATEIPDPPVPGAFGAIHAYLDAGWTVAVLSARSSTVAGRAAMIEWFKKYGATFWDCDRFILPEHKPPAVLYVDDRGWQFTGNNFPTVQELENFTPWNK